MYCLDCGTPMEKRYGTTGMSYHYVGYTEVHDVDYYICLGCDDQSFPANTCHKLDIAHKAKKDDWLKEQPIKDFIPTGQVLKKLKISRWRLYNRVRKLLWLEHANRRMYYSPSVEQYKKTKDGRFVIAGAKHELTLFTLRGI